MYLVYLLPTPPDRTPTNIGITYRGTPSVTTLVAVRDLVCPKGFFFPHYSNTCPGVRIYK